MNNIRNWLCSFNTGLLHDITKPSSFFLPNAVNSVHIKGQTTVKKIQKNQRIKGNYVTKITEN